MIKIGVFYNGNPIPWNLGAEQPISGKTRAGPKIRGQLRRKRPFDFLVAAQKLGPLFIVRGDLSRQILDKNLERDVLLLGWKNDVENYLQAMDVFLLPSRFEGLGIAAVTPFSHMFRLQIV